MFSSTCMRATISRRMADGSIAKRRAAAAIHHSTQPKSVPGCRPVANTQAATVINTAPAARGLRQLMPMHRRLWTVQASGVHPPISDAVVASAGPAIPKCGMSMAFEGMFSAEEARESLNARWKCPVIPNVAPTALMYPSLRHRA